MSSARRVELALPATWLLAVARGRMTSYAPSDWKEEQAVSQPGSAGADVQTVRFLRTVPASSPAPPHHRPPPRGAGPGMVTLSLEPKGLPSDL